MGAGQSNGIEIGGSSMGYQVLRVYPNGPGAQAGLKAYFDFIVAIGNTRFNRETGALREILKASIDQKLKMLIFNTRTKLVRETEIVPSTNWGGNGLLGVSIKHTSFDRADERVWHVVEVERGSPAEKAGLKPDEDYVIGADSILQENDDLYNLIESHEGKALKLFVYNVNTDNCREVVCYPNSRWGGSGFMGCEFGHGLLHRIKQAQAQAQTTTTAPQNQMSQQNPLSLNNLGQSRESPNPNGPLQAAPTQSSNVVQPHQPLPVMQQQQQQQLPFQQSSTAPLLQQQQPSPLLHQQAQQQLPPQPQFNQQQLPPLQQPQQNQYQPPPQLAPQPSQLQQQDQPKQYQPPPQLPPPLMPPKPPQSQQQDQPKPYPPPPPQQPQLQQQDQPEQYQPSPQVPMQQPQLQQQQQFQYQPPSQQLNSQPPQLPQQDLYQPPQLLPQPPQLQQQHQYQPPSMPPQQPNLQQQNSYQPTPQQQLPPQSVQLQQQDQYQPPPPMMPPQPPQLQQQHPRYPPQ